MCSSSGPCSVALDRRAAGRQVDRASPSRSSRATGRSRSAGRARPARSPTSSTSSRRAVSLGRLALDVAHAGRDLARSASYGGRYWRTSTTDGLPSASNTSGTHADRAGRAHDVALRTRSPSGPSKSATTTCQTCPWWTWRSPRWRKPGIASAASLRHVRRDRPSAASTHDGAPRSARSLSAAPTRSRNSGCGRSGRLLNSGWACVPTQNGWSAQLDELDQPAVGRGAAAHEAGRLEAGPGSWG